MKATKVGEDPQPAATTTMKPLAVHFSAEDSYRADGCWRERLEINATSRNDAWNATVDSGENHEARSLLDRLESDPRPHPGLVRQDLQPALAPQAHSMEHKQAAVSLQQ